jgi:hypothetical protein
VGDSEEVRLKLKSSIPRIGRPVGALSASRQ